LKFLIEKEGPIFWKKNFYVPFKCHVKVGVLLDRWRPKLSEKF